MLPEPARHALTTPDGWALDVLDYQPAAPARAIVVLGHAMMVDRRTMAHPERASLASVLLASDVRVLVPDLRGHGASAPRADDGAAWTYDDIVADTALYVELARRLAPDLPLVLVGHSLFGHTALAWLGQRPDAPVDAVVALGVNIWNRRWETNPARWLLKTALVRFAMLMGRRWGYVPVRRFRLGNTDESLGYWADFLRFTTSNRWDSRAGVDYHQLLRRVRCPVLHVLSEGDRLAGEPDTATAFLAPLPRREVWRLGPACDIAALQGLEPDHMDLVTHPMSQPLWYRLAGWIRQVTASAG